MLKYSLSSFQGGVCWVGVGPPLPDDSQKHQDFLKEHLMGFGDPSRKNLHFQLLGRGITQKISFNASDISLNDHYINHFTSLGKTTMFELVQNFVYQKYMRK